MRSSLRLTNVYGPGMHPKDSFVARLMRAIRGERELEIYGDGLQRRDYVHAWDVIDAMKISLVNEDWHGPVVIGSASRCPCSRSSTRCGRSPALRSPSGTGRPGQARCRP